MASIDKRPNGQWRARWREYPGGPQTAAHFPRKIDAERHLTKVQHDLLTGTYVEPEAARVSVEDYYRTWRDRMAPTWRPNTLGKVENTFDRHVLPVLGKRPVGAVRRADVEAFAATLKLAPSTVGIVAQHVGQMFAAAVDDGLIVRNPTYRARLPRGDGNKAQPVDLEIIERIRVALPEWARVAVPLGVGVGLRQGEVSGLTLDRVHFLRRTLRVDRQLVDRYVPEPVLSPPKTDSSNRTIPLATFVVEALSAHVVAFDVESDGLVLADPRGRIVTSDLFGQVWRPACKAAGVPGLRFHALRHTFASTLLSRGVSVKAVSEWLGHASPVITLTTYAHLMPADEDVARSVLDEALDPSQTPARQDDPASRPVTKNFGMGPHPASIAGS